MQSSSSPSTFAEVIASLAVLHQEQHQALLDLRTDQERRFQAIVQAQQEDRERFRSWIDREVRQETIGQPAAPTHLPLNKMGPSDDPEAFLDLFERSAEASWSPSSRGNRRWRRSSCQQRTSWSLTTFGRPFVLAQQLRDSCRKWLLAEGSDVDRIIDRVVLEQFITRLPKKTAEWVQCHRPTSLDSAIELAEDHMVACQGVGEPLPSASLSPSFNSPSLSKPVPLPRSRPPGPPRVPPRGRGGTEQGPYYGPRAPPRGAGLPAAGPDSAPASPLSPRQPFNPLPATRAAGRSGPACWRCGDPEHFVDRCPVMEVGTLIRVPDDPQAAPSQAGEYQIP
ncbi:uncharacterized protein LOC125250521 [Megalobrama amblycephala]|uniref:uncharacterized protein LOC125250521 n=1 Tax=Megalobrama amblycephala TaxID=75352 RepID=UPI0020143244|nr:uncharacterized protein LOC125250521 [Megalobrama amblycephala]